MWEKCGMSRNAEGLKEAMSEIKALREDFYKNVSVPGTATELNAELEKAGRVADFLESVELGGEQEGEAKRNDVDFAFVSAWEYKGEPGDAVLHKEQLEFNEIELKQRSYK